MPVCVCVCVQEGHTAHATPEEAEEEAMRMIRVYEQLAVTQVSMWSRVLESCLPAPPLGRPRGWGQLRSATRAQLDFRLSRRKLCHTDMCMADNRTVTATANSLSVTMLRHLDCPAWSVLTCIQLRASTFCSWYCAGCHACDCWAQEQAGVVCWCQHHLHH